MHSLPYAQIQTTNNFSSSRGNTTLESAVTLTKSIRLDIQSLGVRLQKAASAKEQSRKIRSKSKSKPQHEIEIREIVKDIKRLLKRIKDAIPLMNLAITTSGASMSTSLPPTVSPSRLLQASTFLNAGDHTYSMNPNVSAQIGPTFTLSLYMLFAGHVNRPHNDTDGMRDTTWKEVIHKAKVRLMRVPLRSTYGPFISGHTSPNTPLVESIEGQEESLVPGDGSASEFAYHLEIVEDLDDDRVHSLEDDERQPGPYGDVELAGIREDLPIFQISKIFYADTGKILNIGNQGEANNPVLLLKRDINALPPRRMMGDDEPDQRDALPKEDVLLEADAEGEGIPKSDSGIEEDSEGDDSQDDIDRQLRRESSVHVALESEEPQYHEEPSPWRLPAYLDPEWMAFEVYTETEDSASEDGQEVHDDSAYVSHRPSSSGEGQNEDVLSSELANLKLDPNSPSPKPTSPSQFSSRTSLQVSASPKQSPFGSIRTSLSLLEMLIRLTALQQFQQTSHLAIHDELLNFFLDESSTTGGNGDERRRTRHEARRKVGFDPYDESPVKRRGEDYQYQNQAQDGYQGYSRDGTPYDENERPGGYYPSSPREWSRGSPQRTPEPWLARSREASGTSVLGTPDAPASSPISPYRPLHRKGTGPLDRIKQERGSVKPRGSPLGRGVSVDTDSTLGTSPGSPTLVDRKDRATEL